MKIIKYHESYSSEGLKKLRPITFLRWGFIILFLLLIFIPKLRDYAWILVQSNKLAGFVIFLVLVILIKYLFSSNFSEYKFKYGKEGEEKVQQILAESLNNDYIYVPNYIIPNTKIGDIDGLLISPKGIIILEIKNYVGIFRASGNDLYRKLGKYIFKLYYKNPFQQVLRQKEYLGKFLKEKGINLPIIPIVVLVEGKLQTTKKYEVFITEDINLIKFILNLANMSNFIEDLSEKIIIALELNQIKNTP